MRNSVLAISLIAFLLAVRPLSAGLVLPQREPAAGSWQETRVLELSMAAARVRVSTRMEGRGFRLKHDIALDWRETRRLMLWEKGDRQIIVMLWRIDVGQTGCSWGEVKDDDD